MSSRSLSKCRYSSSNLFKDSCHKLFLKAVFFHFETSKSTNMHANMDKDKLSELALLSYYQLKQNWGKKFIVPTLLILLFC